METNNTVFLGNKRSCFSVLLGNEQSCFSVPAGLPCKKQNCCFVLNLDLDASFDGRKPGWWAHTKQHSCASLHSLWLPLFQTSQSGRTYAHAYSLQLRESLLHACQLIHARRSRSVLFFRSTRQRNGCVCMQDLTSIWTRSTLEIDKAGPTDDKHACIWPYC